MKKAILTLSALFVLTILMNNITAESLNDPTGDVLFWKSNDGNWGWYTTGSATKPEIDITSITSSFSNGRLTLQMKVAGAIDDSSLTTYLMMLNTSDSVYYFSYASGTGGGYGINNEEYAMETEFSISTSGNTITASIDSVSQDEMIQELWGYARTMNQFIPGATDIEMWQDWSPNTKEPFSYEDDTNDLTDDTDTTDGQIDTKGQQTNTEYPNGGSSMGNKGPGTPGFELALLIASLIGLLLIMKRRT